MGDPDWTKVAKEPMVLKRWEWWKHLYDLLVTVGAHPEANEIARQCGAERDGGSK